MNFHMISQNQRDLFEPQKSKLKLPKYNWSLNDRLLIAIICLIIPCFFLEGSMSQKMHFDFYFTQK